MAHDGVTIGLEPQKSVTLDVLDHGSWRTFADGEVYPATVILAVNTLALQTKIVLTIDQARTVSAALAEMAAKSEGSPINVLYPDRWHRPPAPATDGAE